MGRVACRALAIVVALTFGFSNSFYFLTHNHMLAQCTYTTYTSVSCMVGALSVVASGGGVLSVRGDPSRDSSYCLAQHLVLRRSLGMFYFSDAPPPTCLDFKPNPWTVFLFFLSFPVSLLSWLYSNLQ